MRTATHQGHAERRLVKGERRRNERVQAGGPKDPEGLPRQGGPLAPLADAAQEARNPEAVVAVQVRNKQRLHAPRVYLRLLHLQQRRTGFRDQGRTPLPSNGRQVIGMAPD